MNRLTKSFTRFERRLVAALAAFSNASTRILTGLCSRGLYKNMEIMINKG